MMKSGSGRGSGGVFVPENPMLNTLVLDNLFQVAELTSRDIAQARRVCTAWKQASSKAWRSSSAILTISEHYYNTPEDDDDLVGKAGLDRVQERKHVGLVPFLRLIRGDPPTAKDYNGENYYSTARKLFCSFRLCRRSPARRGDTLKKATASDRLEFWRVCGSWIKLLVLDGMDFLDSERFRDIIFRDTPNLRELTVDGCYFREAVSPPTGGLARQTPVQAKLEYLRVNCLTTRSYVGTLPLPWNEIITFFPNLKTLILTDFPMEDERDVGDDNGGDEERPNGQEGSILEKVMRAVVQRQRGGGPLPSSLANLEISKEPTIINLSIVNLFRDAALPLEFLSLDITSGCDEPVVRTLLGLHAETLKNLRVVRSFRCRYAERGAIPYSDFLGGAGGVHYYERLVELRLCGWMASDFGFLQHVPALQVLHILSSRSFLLSGPGLFDRFHPVIIPSSSSADASSPARNSVNEKLRMEQLTEFKTDFWIEDPSKFLKVAKWMPFITRLSVPLDGTTFGVVCTVWVDTLKELHFPFGTQIGDEELTGISPDEAKRRRSLRNRPANLTNLKELGKFSQDESRDRITMDGVPMTFSGHAVTHGFLLLPKLWSLQLFVYREATANVIRKLFQEKIHHLDIRVCKDPYK